MKFNLFEFEKIVSESGIRDKSFGGYYYGWEEEDLCFVEYCANHADEMIEYIRKLEKMAEAVGVQIS